MIITIPLVDDVKCVNCKKNYEFNLSDHWLRFLGNNNFVCWKCLGISRKKFLWFIKEIYIKKK
jgi:hypothetical protein